MSGYCFDTSAFMEPWNRWYPPDIFPALWGTLAEQISRGLIVSPYEVKREIQSKDDTLYRWLKEHDGLFIEESVNVLAFVQREIYAVERFRRITEAGRNGADPIVIALAQVMGRAVVTNEQRPGPASNRVKIPTICDYFGIRCLRPLDYYRETGISI